MAHKHVKVNKLGASGKEEQFWGSIEREKLDTLRYTLLHSGLNVARLQNEDGLTGLQVAAKNGKDTALLLMLDIFRQQRSVKEAVDVPDDEGRTPLMYAAAAGHVKCVDHLLYYQASLTAKSDEGLTARDYAVKYKRKDVIAYLDDDGKDDEDDDGAAGDAVDADGLTSTQRNKLKKKQMKEAEKKGMIAAVSAAATASDGADAAADGVASLSISDSGAASASNSSSSSSAAAAGVVGANGLIPLSSVLPKPRWAELAHVIADKRRELKVDRTGAHASGNGEEPDANGLSGEEVVDPALWYAGQVNRLELKLPNFVSLSPQIGHLAHLQTLILSGNALTSVPDTLSLLTELKHLDLSHNALEALPPAVGKLPKLEVLSIMDNKLTSLAPLAPCTSLLILLADRNLLTDIPLAYADLARLDTLSLSGNKLTSLPEEVRGQY